jgi:ribosomal protein S18 acetylase RimI-like enzyme
VTRIREFASTDGDALRSLWSDAGFRLIADDDPGLTRFAARNPGLFLVAEDASGIVASAMGGWDGRRGWLYHVAVVPSRRRSGLASRLVELVEGRLRELGCPRVSVIVEAANEGAVAFWRARGYELRDTHQLGKTLIPG